MLRAPGESLRARIAADEPVVTYLIVMFVLSPLIVYSIHVSQSYFSGMAESWWRIASSLAIVVIAELLVAKKLFRFVDQQRKIVLGMEAECAVAEELNQLMREGAIVYHDIPTEYGNIDHVVLMPTGVFAIETKAISKANVRKDSAEVDVDYNDNVIHFAGLKPWPIPVRQLETSASWLSRKLSEATGRRVPVHPMLALPGYYFKPRTGKANYTVFNPKNAIQFFRKAMLVHTVDSVLHMAQVIEFHARTVEPSFGYRNRESPFDAS